MGLAGPVVRASFTVGCALLASCAALTGLTGGGNDGVTPPDSGAGGDADDATSHDDAQGGSDSPADVVRADVAPPVEAGGACDPKKDFGPPQLVKELSTNTFEDTLEDLSADQLTAYIGSNRAGSGMHIFVATRASATGAWGAPAPLFTIGAYDDWNIAVTADGLQAIVASDRGGQSDLFVATRPNVLSQFGAQGLASGVNTTSDEQTPQWSADGQTLYFDSSRDGSRDLFRAPLQGASFGAPTAIAELNTAAIEASPVLSADELTIYFLSTRKPTIDGDIYVATRASKSAQFGAPVTVPALNSASLDGPSWLSPDGCVMYLSSTRGAGGGSFDVYVARRPL